MFITSNSIQQLLPNLPLISQKQTIQKMKPLLFLLLNTFFLLTTTNSLPHQQFREAPKFYNSPNCPSTNPFNNAFNEGKNDNSIICSDHAVHVAMTLDAAYLRGSAAAVFSVLLHSACPENLFFHFVSAAGDGGGGGGAPPIAAVFPDLNYRIYPFDGGAVAGLISAAVRPALDSPLNYARIHLAALLPPCVRRVVYLDSDVVLVDDVARLAATPLGGGAVLAAPEYCGANFTAYFTPTFWSHPSLPLTFAGRRRPCYFNTGVMIIDLTRWRAGDYTRKIEWWMITQKNTRIYELGSLPPFLLVFAGRIAPVDHRWNQHGLGGDNYRGLCRALHPGPVSLLHWSGKGKPWARLDAGRPCPVDELWAPYDLLKPPFAFDS